MWIQSCNVMSRAVKISLLLFEEEAKHILLLVYEGSKEQDLFHRYYGYKQNA